MVKDRSKEHYYFRVGDSDTSPSRHSSSVVSSDYLRQYRREFAMGGRFFRGAGELLPEHRALLAASAMRLCEECHAG